MQEETAIPAAANTVAGALDLVAYLEKTPDGIVTGLVAKDALFALAAVIRPLTAEDVTPAETIDLGLANASMNAEYWSKAARKTEDPAEAVMCMEQARNAWKNAAYAMARLLRSKGTWITDRAPDHGVNVLFYTSAALWIGWRDENSKDEESGKFRWRDHFDDQPICTDADVLGWMPCPEVPRGE